LEIYFWAIGNGSEVKITRISLRRKIFARDVDGKIEHAAVGVANKKSVG